MSSITCTQTQVHVVYIKAFQNSIFKKTNYCDLVTLCHVSCISYGLAHVLSNFQLLTVSRTPHQIYKYCNFLASCATPLRSLLGKDLHECLLPNFKFFFPGPQAVFTLTDLLIRCSGMSTIVFSNQSNVFLLYFVDGIPYVYNGRSIESSGYTVG